MKILNYLLFSLITTSMANAFTLSFPAMESNVKTHSQKDLENVEFIISVSCSTSRPMSDSSESCGTNQIKSKKTLIKNSITKISFDNMKMKFQRKKFMKLQHFQIALIAIDHLTGKSSHIDFINHYYRNDDTKVADLNSTFNFLTKSELRNSFNRFQEAIEEISIFHITKKDVQFLNTDGSDARGDILKNYDKADELRYFLSLEVEGGNEFYDTNEEKSLGNLFSNISNNIKLSSFQTPQLETLFCAKRGYPVKTAKVQLKYSIRYEPQNWREYDWGASWKTIQESFSEVDLDNLSYPEYSYNVEVNESWWDFLIK